MSSGLVPRRRHDGNRRWPSPTLTVATALLVATVTLVALAWNAVGEMRRNASLLVERRASEVAALTAVALNRDMKGAWLSVLVPTSGVTLTEDPPYNVLERTSRTFATFPYPDSIIVWAARSRSQRQDRTFALTRADRPVPWAAPDTDGQPYPVVVTREPPGLTELLDRLRDDADPSRPYVLLELPLGGTPYQVVARLLFETAAQPKLAGVVAMTVNLDWVRREYLPTLLRQIATIDGERDAMAITVHDESGTELATSHAVRAASPVRRRLVPRVFFEPALVSSMPRGSVSPRTWTVLVQPVGGVEDAAAVVGTRVLLLASVTGGISLVALLMTLRAVRLQAQLVAMKSEFVASVTHELKTPLALFKLVGETLEKGRYTSQQTIREYASILSQQERRLSHLVDNLLTYARLNDLPTLHEAGAVDIGEVIEDALEPFRPRLRELGFAVTVSVAPDLPQVRGDRAALVQAVANLVDNAVKYSADDRQIEVGAAPEGRQVRLWVSDKGPGIPAEDHSRVFDRFVRGHDAGGFGSGLGLAIVRRTVAHHGGSVGIARQQGRGTTVDIRLPALTRS